MPLCRRYNYLILTQDDLSGWIKEKSLTVKLLSAVIKFLWENLICWFGIFEKLIIDERSEFNSIVKDLVKKYEIH